MSVDNIEITWENKIARTLAAVGIHLRNGEIEAAGTKGLERLQMNCGQLENVEDFPHRTLRPLSYSTILFLSLTPGSRFPYKGFVKVWAQS